MTRQEHWDAYVENNKLARAMLHLCAIGWSEKKFAEYKMYSKEANKHFGIVRRMNGAITI